MKTKLFENVPVMCYSLSQSC